MYYVADYKIRTWKLKIKHDIWERKEKGSFFKIIKNLKSSGKQARMGGQMDIQQLHRQYSQVGRQTGRQTGIYQFPLSPLVACHDITDGVDPHMTKVKVATGVREHGQGIECFFIILKCGH